MHPALSIILFTTLSGSGLGLGFLLGVSVVGSTPLAVATAAAISIGLAGCGLIASVFHLRRPSRAWRALSQWRTSWLSREGIIAPLALAALFAYAVAAWWELSGSEGIGLLAAALCAAAVFATSMIYRQIRAVAAWSGWLTPVMFLALAAAGGALLGAVIESVTHSAGIPLLICALAFNLVAWILVYGWWKRLDRVGMGASDMESATGLGGKGKIRHLEPPHTGSNYLLTEMGYSIARKHSSKLRTIALLTGGLGPTILIACALLWADAPFLVPAAILHLAGVGVSRWLFFAEAKHTVQLYYGQGSGS